MRDAAGSTFAAKTARLGDRDAIDRLQNEIAVLQELDHPQIPSYVADGTEGNLRYLVMERMQGSSIRSKLSSYQESNKHYSDVEALQIGVKLLGVLAYLHGLDEPLVHRDVKDANVILTTPAGSVSLIDFGFAKPDGAVDRRFADSFFRAGAPRYAPPEKHEHPAVAKASHDVFAVGVLMYQMMTLFFPWSASPSRADDALVDAMLAGPPPDISDFNSTVRPEVCRFVARLLELRDEYRMSASEALDEARELLGALPQFGRPDWRTRYIEFPHVWRDPVHHDIRLTELEVRAIDTREMQRLGRMKQLGLTDLVFRGATHTRLQHAVGCIARVETILSTIEAIEGKRFDNETRLVARMYALLHDLPHMAFGHTLEDELGFYVPHDDNVPRMQQLVFDPSSDIGRLLQGSEIGREARAFFDPSSTIHARSDVRQLVSGPTGADVLDYIDRDAYYCGVDHRVDSAMFRQFRLVPMAGAGDARIVSLQAGGHGVRLDREYAIESLFNERYAMFLKVYAHKTKAKASAVLGKAFALAQLRGQPQFGDDAVHWLGDQTLVDELGRRERVRAVVNQLTERRALPSAVYRATVIDPEDRTKPDIHGIQVADFRNRGYLDPAGRLELEERLARAARIRHPDRVMVYLPQSAPGFQKTQELFVAHRDHDPGRPEVGRWFHDIQRRHLGLWEIWVFTSAEVDEEERRRLADQAQQEFARDNQIRIHPRQTRLPV